MKFYLYSQRAFLIVVFGAFSITSTAQKTTWQRSLGLPQSSNVKKVLVNGKNAATTTDGVKNSIYVVTRGWSGKQTEIIVLYN